MHNHSLVLSLFPGIGLLDMAFEDAGFCVVRGPDTLWGGDVKTFSPPAGRFDGIIGGPPCQAFSRLRHIVEYNGYALAENLIPEFERVVSEAQPAWFLMENVPAAPTAQVDGYHVQVLTLRDHWFGGETGRKRKFCFGSQDGVEIHPMFLAIHTPCPAPSVLANGGTRQRPVAIGGNKRRKGALSTMGYANKRDLAGALQAQGLPEDFLDKAPFTIKGKMKVIGNGVPLATGRALARAVKEAFDEVQA